MQKDNKERSNGNTVEADQKELASIRSGLLNYVRVRGLPADPVELDVKAVSQLPDASIIDNVEEKDVPPKIIDISSLTLNHSAVALSIRQKRLEDKERKTA